MGQIRVTPDTLRTRAGQYTTEQGNMSTMIETLDGLLESIQSEWEGSASAAYAEKYAELKPGFAAVEELLGEISSALNSVADAMEEMDATIADQFRA